MNTFKYIFCILIMLGLETYAQTCDLQFVVDTNNGTNYVVRVQIKGSSSFLLGTSNITINYNSTDLGDPSLGTAYNFNTGSYTLSVSKPLSGVASINIVYSGSSGNGDPVGTSFIDVASISFPTLNPSGSSNLSFRTSTPNKTGVFEDNNSTLVSEGTWSSLNTTPLPVELTSFTGSANNDVVNLTWKTATEVNNYGFEVQRSAVSGQQSADTSWQKIGFVKGAGNSNSPQSYSYIDNNVTGGTQFKYRLKQIDNNGKYEYSNDVEVTIAPAQYTLYQNYPNPFNPTTTIRFNLPKAARVTLIIYNIVGQEVDKLINNQDLSAGFHSATFDGKRLASGTYIYRLQADNFTQIKKMILLK